MEVLKLSDEEIVGSFMDDAAGFISNLPFSVEPVITHKFFPGVYIRQMLLPYAGIQLISKVHKKEHAFMVSMGRILVYDGIHEAIILKAPFTGRTMPGGQRYGISLEPVMWSNIHPTKIQPKDSSEEAILDAVNKIEKLVVEPYNILKKLNKKEVS